MASVPTIIQPRILRPYVPVTPTPKQHAAMLLHHIEEVLYGGAGGGGKSVWLLAEAAAYVDHPGYSAILLRETWGNLLREPNGLIPMSHDWFGRTDAHWSGDRNTWTFPSGATIAFGHMHNPTDHNQYAGPEYQFVGFDETTEIRPYQYQFMASRMRRLAGSDIPIRRRAATNPGGRHHDYYANRFGLDGKDQQAPGTLYIPARLWDNPHLDMEDYNRRLSVLDPVLRARIRDGDWSIDETGQMFRVDAVSVVDGPAPGHCRRIRMWDFAAETPVGGSDPDWTVGTRLAVDPHTTGDKDEDGNPLPPLTYVEDVIRIREHPDKVNAVVNATAQRDGKTVQVGMEQEFGAAGKHLVAFWKRSLPQHTVVGIPPSGSKTERARWFAAAVNSGRVALVAGPWIDEWLREVGRFPTPGVHDDQVDTAAYAYNRLAMVGQATARRARGSVGR